MKTKNSIFSNYHNKLKSLVKSIISCYSSELRFFFYFKNKDKFPYFSETYPIGSSKKENLKVGVYLTDSFKPQKKSDPWKGCLPHFNSTVTQIPLFSLSESDNHDFVNWFSKKNPTYQKEIIGDVKYKSYSSGSYSHSQIFDFSRTNITIANL